MAEEIAMLLASSPSCFSKTGSRVSWYRGPSCDMSSARQKVHFLRPLEKNCKLHTSDVLSLHVCKVRYRKRETSRNWIRKRQRECHRQWRLCQKRTGLANYVDRGRRLTSASSSCPSRRPVLKAPHLAQG